MLLFQILWLMANNLRRISNHLRACCDLYALHWILEREKPAALLLVTQSSREAERGEPTSNQKLSILVVDDDQALLKLARRFLELNGYGVITASDGERALQLLGAEKPSLIILDVRMPGLNGYQVCEQVRKLSNVPIIMLTAKSQLDDVMRGFAVGADDYVTKPFGVDELLARVKAVLRRFSLPSAPTVGVGT
jgi:CheY-like chemotaxis protein